MRQVTVPKAYDNQHVKVLRMWDLWAIDEPQGLMLPIGLRFLHGVFYRKPNEYVHPWHWRLYYEDRTPGAAKSLRVFQSFQLVTSEIPNCCEHVASGVVWNYGPRGERTNPCNAWHLYEFPAGTKLSEVNVQE